jgi:hypothetical protein
MYMVISFQTFHSRRRRFVDWDKALQRRKAEKKMELFTQCM